MKLTNASETGTESFDSCRRCGSLTLQTVVRLEVDGPGGFRIVTACYCENHPLPESIVDGEDPDAPASVVVESNPAIRLLHAPTIESLHAELHALESAGVGRDVPLAISVIANMPATICIREA